MWLLAFLPYLHWFGPLVDGAVVLTTPSNLAPPRPPRLNNADLPSIHVIDKERGAEVQAADLFSTGIALMSGLAQQDFTGNIPSQAWSMGDLILGVSVYERWKEVPRYYLLYGFYFIFLLMKQEKDFRSGVFEVIYLNKPICDLIILPTKISGSHLAITFTNVTQLDPPPSPIAGSTNSYSELVIFNTPLSLNVTMIEPHLVQPMDEVDELINFVDMLVTIAEPPTNATVEKNIVSNVPYSSVKISLNLTHADTPDPFTYDLLIWAVSAMSRSGTGFLFKGQATRGQILFGDDATNIGELTVVPSNSTPSTSPLIEAAVNADTATARKRWSIA